MQREIDKLFSNESVAEQKFSKIRCLSYAAAFQTTKSRQTISCYFHFTIKPVAIGGGIAFFAWSLISLTGGLVGEPSAIFPAIILAIFCSCDALICDLEDIEFDLSNGCKTLASQMQPRNIWLLTSLCFIFLSFFLPVKIQLIAICLIPLPLFKMLNTRLIVDLRPALVLLIAWAI